MQYATLAEAFAAAQENETITVLENLDVVEMIPVTKSVTLDLNGKTITNNVTGNRLFRLSGITFTIDGKNGSIITPDTNTNSYGIVVLRDANNVASENTKLIASDVNFEGIVDDDTFFRFCADGQTIEFTNVNANLKSCQAWSIINGYSHNNLNITLKGGTYTYDSTVKTAGVFQANENSTINFEGVTVNSTSGPIFEVWGSTANFTDCTMTNTATNSYFATCIAPSGGSQVTIDGGTYTANYPVYIYTSGGALNIENGEFNGKIASIKADNAQGAQHESTVNVTAGTFNGPISLDNRSTIEVAENSSMVQTTDAEGKTVYIAAPLTSDIAAYVGTTPYTTLAEAFEAAEDGQEVVVFKDQDITDVIRLTKSLTLDLNGKTLTNKVAGNAMFCINGPEFIIDGKSDIGDTAGTIVTPDTNTNSFGLIAFTVRGDAFEDTKLTASDVNFEGIVNNDTFFKFCANGQSIDFTNVNVDLKSCQAYSIINGYDYKNLNINLKGGTYNYDSTVENVGVFQTNKNSSINFDGVTVNTNRGPVFEVWGSTAKFTDCTMTNTSTNGFSAACVALANGSQVTVDGGTYTANYPLYIYTTGGTLNVEGGNFHGSEAALMVSNQDGTTYSSAANVSDGYFEGPLMTTGANSTIQLQGGTYTERPADEYVAQGYKATENPDGTFVVEEDINTGIDAIEAAGTDAGYIYNLSGERIYSDVKNLPAGIYIIGGKKVVVRNR